MSHRTFIYTGALALLLLSLPGALAGYSLSGSDPIGDVTYPNVDIVSFGTVDNPSANEVEVYLVVAGNIEWNDGVAYYLYLGRENASWVLWSNGTGQFWTSSSYSYINFTVSGDRISTKVMRSVSTLGPESGFQAQAYAVISSDTLHAYDWGYVENGGGGGGGGPPFHSPFSGMFMGLPILFWGAALIGLIILVVVVVVVMKVLSEKKTGTAGQVQQQPPAAPVTPQQPAQVPPSPPGGLERPPPPG